MTNSLKCLNRNPIYSPTSHNYFLGYRQPRSNNYNLVHNLDEDVSRHLVQVHFGNAAIGKK